MYEERQIGSATANPSLGPPPPSGKSSSGYPLDLARVVRALRTGWRALAVVAVLGAVAGYVVPKFLMPREWFSIAQLVYEGMPIEKDGEKTIEADPRDLRTMVDSVKLPTNLRRVQEEVGENGPLDRFAERIAVSFDELSNLISISAVAETSSGSAELANTMVDIFIDHRASVDRERLRKIAEDIDRDLELAEAAVNEARQRYKGFRDERGIVDLGVEREQGIEEAAAYRARAVEAAEQITKLQAQINARESAVENGGGPRGTAADRTALRQAQAALRDARTRYTDAHPKVQEQIQRVEILQEKIDASGASGANTAKLKMELAQAKELERRLRERADAAEATINRFSNDEGTASSMLAAIQVAEAQVKKLRDELVKAEANARTPRSGFRIESPAVAPQLPQPSKARYAVAAGIPAAAILLVLIILFWREFGDMTIRTASETAYWGRGPVVGSTTWPRDSELLDALVAEMDDYLVDTAGRTLVVPATDRELALAEAISRRLTGLDDATAGNVHVTVQPSAALDGKQAIELPPSPAEAGTAIATRPERGTLVRDEDAPWSLSAEAWTGPAAGPSIRRAARMSDRVLVVAQAGQTRFSEMRAVPGRLGRESGIGYLLVGVEEDFKRLPDRAGNVGEFWYAYRA